MDLVGSGNVESSKIEFFVGVTCSEPKENNESKYDRSHADEINQTHTFSCTSHFILPRSGPKAVAPHLVIE